MGRTELFQSALQASQSLPSGTLVQGAGTNNVSPTNIAVDANNNITLPSGSTLNQTNGGFTQFWKISAVNVLATGQTLILPAITGKKFIPTQILIEMNSLTGVLTVPIVRLGNNGSFNNVAPLFTCTGIGTVGNILTITLNTIPTTIDIGSTGISFDVQTAGIVASVATVNVFLFGILK